MALVACLCLAPLSARANAQSATHPAYLSRYPDNGTPNWGDNDTATQGLAQDGGHWYISATGTGTIGIAENQDWIIWRIPVTESLDQDFYRSRNAGVRHVRRSDVPALDRRGVNHPGDMDCYGYRHGGVRHDFLMVPMRDQGGPIIAAFRAATLEFIGDVPVGDQTDSVGKQKDIGWCAVSPRGRLVTSNDDASRLFFYHVDWPRLVAGRGLSMSLDGSADLLTERGETLKLSNIQGGDFSADGALLYVSCGKSFDKRRTDGIHVLDTTTWRRLARSTNPERGESGPFSYSFDNGALPPDEPEGLVVWDLDDGRAPGIRGQLHALVYSWRVTSSHKVTLMHYGMRAKRARMGVWLYEHPGYRGDSRYFDTDCPDLDLGTINFADVASSIRLVGNPQVILYDGHRFTGRFIRLTRDVPDLRTLGWNDLAGSLRITPSSPLETPRRAVRARPHAVTRATARSQARPGIFLFEHPNYRGDYRYFEGDIWDLDLGTINFADVASSIRIVGGARVTVFDGHHFTGASCLITGNIPDLRKWCWNDRIGSLRFGQ